MTPGVIVTVLAIMGLLYSLWWLVDRMIDRRLPSLPRPDRRLPARDYRLLGLDWREPVAPYFHRSVERSNRRRMAVISACGIDPDKNETRTVDAAGFQDQ